MKTKAIFQNTKSESWLRRTPPTGLPWGPAMKTLRLHCRGCAFKPWLGTQDPPCLVAWSKKKTFLKQENQEQGCCCHRELGMWYDKELKKKQKLPQLLLSSHKLNRILRIYTYTTHTVKSLGLSSSFAIPWTVAC